MSRRLRCGQVLMLALACAIAVSTSSQELGDAVRGKRLFLQCQACHSLQTNDSATVGPTLAMIVGRKAASVAGYSYSPALLASGLVWNEATLDKWLEQPNALVPGTKMIFAGLPKREDRLSIIAYLAKSMSSNAP